MYIEVRRHLLQIYTYKSLQQDRNFSINFSKTENPFGVVLRQPEA